MKNKIDQIIQYLLFLRKKKEYVKKKFLIVSFDNCLIEEIRKKYSTKFNSFSTTPPPTTVVISTIEKFLEKISGLSLSHRDYVLLFFFYILKKKTVF